MELYLITGFLGAGKTTFLKNLIYMFKDKRIHMVINEFGKEGVDGDLVSHLNAALSEINNGSIFCACRLDKFEEELNIIMENKPEVVIVEASGLSDPTNVKKILDQKEYSSIDYKGSICIVDGARFLKVASTARVVPKQLKVSSLALLNKTDLIDENQIKEVSEKIKEINPVITIENTTFGEMKKEWLSHLKSDVEVEEAMNIQDITLQKATVVINGQMDLLNLKGFLNLVGEQTYRIKGFVFIQGKVYLANCVGGYIKVEDYNGDYSNLNRLVVLAGTGMSLRKILKESQNHYGNYIEEIIYG